MRFRPPYTVEEIEATPFEYDRPWRETRRAKMWQARIDYWDRQVHFWTAATYVVLVAFVVLLVVVAVRY